MIKNNKNRILTGYQTHPVLTNYATKFQPLTVKNMGKQINEIFF